MCCQDEIEVRLPDRGDVSTGDRAAPSMFVWHGRLYVVRQVLNSWSERVPWWRSTVQPDPPVGAVPERGDHRVWRVEASPGRALGTATYDLACVPPPPLAGHLRPTWTLIRVAD
nr:DUF6504 family protein [Luteipulveratus mongoliensis]